MTIHIYRNLIYLSLRSSSHLYKTQASSSSCLLFFSSTTRENQKSTVTVADYLLHEHQFSPETAMKVSSIVTHLKNPKRTDSILSFLKRSGFLQTHLEKIVKRQPSVLFANLNKTIKPKIKIFRDLGFSSSDVAEIVSHEPWILSRNADKQVGSSISYLKDVLGSNLDVPRVLKISDWFLKHDLEKTMMPNVEYMKISGISSSQIMKYIYNFPRFFLHKPETFKEFVKRADEMGFNRNSKMFIHAIRAVSSMSVENWKLKLDLLRSLGFSEDDIIAVFQRVPQAFSVSEKKIKEVTQLVFRTGKYDISYVVNHPDLLLCSVENRLKPRLQVLEILEGKNLLQKMPSLTTVYKLSDKRFFEKFVHPYSNEVGNLFMWNQGS